MISIISLILSFFVENTAELMYFRKSDSDIPYTLINSIILFRAFASLPSSASFNTSPTSVVFVRPADALTFASEMLPKLATACIRLMACRRSPPEYSEIPFKIIILDEADEMTSDAQTALRRIIEDTAKFCRFILIANNISKIISPIQSRCAVFKFTAIPEENTISRLKLIAKKEKIKTDDKGLKAISEYSGGDLRHAINLMQAVASLGNISEANVKASAGLTKTTDVGDVLKLALDGKLANARNKMIELIKVYGMSESDFLKYINSAVFSTKNDKMSEIIEIIAKYDYRILVGSNPEIQLSAMLAELGKLGK